MSEYIFDRHAEDREYHRLRMIEAAQDSATISILQHTEIQPGWTCLELGPGAGSIMHWLGNQVGPGGTVLAVDTNTTYVRDVAAPPYVVREGHFLDIPIEQRLDLAHARYVFIHNETHRQMLHKLFHLLNPGSPAVFEEPDFTSVRLWQDHSDNPQNRVNSAICTMFENARLDPGYGLRLPQILETSGFDILKVKAAIHLCKGTSPIARMMAESALALRHRYRETGQCSDEDIDQYILNAHTPHFWSIYYSTVSVIAKRPDASA